MRAMSHAQRPIYSLQMRGHGAANRYVTESSLCSAPLPTLRVIGYLTLTFSRFLHIRDLGGGRVPCVPCVPFQSECSQTGGFFLSGASLSLIIRPGLRAFSSAFLLLIL